MSNIANSPWENVYFAGVRHHGPGSAQMVLKALDTWNPDVVLIEGPPEANDILPQAILPNMKLPLALLCYKKDETALAVFYPFAEFSPEWQALLWALKNNKRVRFIDLPVASKIALDFPNLLDKDVETEVEDDLLAEIESEESPIIFEESQNEEISPSENESIQYLQQALNDPIGVLACIDGFEDGETWWNAKIEQSGAGIDIFTQLCITMQNLRDFVAEKSMDFSEQVSAQIQNQLQRDLLREAYMRLEIHKEVQALAENQSAMVITGAFHTPALTKKVSQKADKELLKGLAKVNVEVTWSPWTDSRLAFDSGYRAGVVSPGWYRHLWQFFQNENHQDPHAKDRLAWTTKWLTDTAVLLRHEGIEVSSASVIEASRLALSLCALRNKTTPGLEELQDASLSSLVFGNSVPLKLVYQKQIIGDTMGAIDENVPTSPFEKDLQKSQKKVQLKPVETAIVVALDLRSKAGIFKSNLLRRLNILEINWGVEIQNSSRGTFRETWTISWKPEFSIQIAAAIPYGTTVERAASNKAVQQAKSAQSTEILAELILQTLMADLPQAARECLTKMQSLSISSASVPELMGACSPLLLVLRYGTARPIPKQELELLVRQMTLVVALQLPLTCSQIDEDFAQNMAQKIDTLHDDLQFLIPDSHDNQDSDNEIWDTWLNALDTLSMAHLAHPRLRGLAVRKLYRSAFLTSQDVQEKVQQELSRGVPTLAAAQWLEGFLTGDAELLLRDPHLVPILDQWLISLNENDFIEILPLLRRCLIHWDLTQKKRLKTLALKSTASVSNIDSDQDHRQWLSPQEVENGANLLKVLLGMEFINE